MNTFWSGRQVLVTGDTGFKGAWLRLWLSQLGARVSGLALPPHTKPSLFAVLGEAGGAHVDADVRDAAAVEAAMQACRPEVVFHLAAQALVRPSYTDPIGTFTTNVIGTLNVLNAARVTSGVAAVVVVTTDKVYENDNSGRPFVEADRLGGKDPYSNSKACAELATQCFRDSFLTRGAKPAVATARAGNVIGGGDWSTDRLVPDVIRAHASGAAVVLRHPEAVRPWQHVLEPLNGYLMLARQLVEAADGGTPPHAVNFGPDPDSFLMVAQVVDALAAALSVHGGTQAGWVREGGANLPEARALTLSSELAKRTLGWRPLLTMRETVAWTADWYAGFARGVDARALTLDQIARYQARIER